MPNRRRPHVTMTPAQETLTGLRAVGRSIGLHSLGVIVDYIFTDWTRLKNAAIETTPIPSDGHEEECRETDFS
jgi:hypothetical protein